jgi:hypothetical protein
MSVEKFQVPLHSEIITGFLHEAILNVRYLAEFFAEFGIFRTNL